MQVEHFVAKHGGRTKPNRGGWLIQCPYHPDRNPSCSVSLEGLFNCFGCGAKGNYAKLLHDIDGKSWKEAIKIAGELPPRHETRGPDDPLDPASIALFYADWRKAYALYQQSQRRGVKLRPPWCYPFERGFTPSDLEYFQVGYDKDAYRLIIPVNDHRGVLTGFIGRACTEGDSKYWNYPPLRTAQHVYGLDKVRTHSHVIVTEGPLDVWGLRRSELPAVATMTAHMSAYQALLLAKYCRQVTLMYDHDDAGKAGAMHAGSTLVVLGVQVRIGMSYSKGAEDPKDCSEDRLYELFEGAAPVFPTSEALRLLQ